MLPEATDRALALRVAQGDAEAFGELVRRHQSAVFNVAYLLLGNRRDAEDVTQEVFIRAFRAFHTFDPERPLRPWLKQIATNYTLNWLESARVRPETTAADLGQPGSENSDLEEWRQESPTPEQALSAQETAGQIGEPRIVKDAKYGEILFYFYQEQYFPAIVRLLAAKERAHPCY